MKVKPSILIVEDEEAIRDGLVDVLVFHGYETDTAADGTTGLDKAMSGRYDLILLDVMLPGLDGYSICNAIRERDREQAIIMLTARTSDDDIVAGLKLGADDYVAKPFSVQQLVLRIAAVLRRSQGIRKRERMLVLDGVNIDTENFSGHRGDEALEFTKREIELLVYLAANSSRPVPREELLSRVWGYAPHVELETRTVDIHIAKLRRKIESNPKEPTILVTVRGAGYRLLTAD